MKIYRAPRWKRRLKKALAAVVIVPLAVVAAYAAYIHMSYHRLPDSAEQHSQNVNIKAELNTDYSVITWNVGFGAYSRDFSFFMDGGEESRARSPEAVWDNLTHIADVMIAEGADHMLLQEVDTNATRSWHINEVELFRIIFDTDQSFFARNYNSPYILWPPRQPHGASTSGLLSLSNLDIFRGERYSLPVEDNPLKYLDLDRCFSLIRIPTADSRYLVLFNAHLSAYSLNGRLPTRQLDKLLRYMNAEYEEGNYVICGGDFNKDLLGDSAGIFGVAPREGITWAQPFDETLIPEGFRLVQSVDPDNPVPSCRDCDTGYVPGTTFVLVTDGFIVSDNVSVVNCNVIDDDFTASDHNPVKLTFRLADGGKAGG